MAPKPFKSEEIIACTNRTFALFLGMIFVTFWSFLIPSVDRSIYFHRVERREIRTDDLELKVGTQRKLTDDFPQFMEKI